jgi:hypothetical protein
MQSLLVFRLGPIGCADGHTGCVQKTILGKRHPRGGEPRKINIAAATVSARGQKAKNLKNSNSEPICNVLKRIPVVITALRGNECALPGPKPYQSMGCFSKIPRRFRHSPPPDGHAPSPANWIVFHKSVQLASGSRLNWCRKAPEYPFTTRCWCGSALRFPRRTHRENSPASPQSPGTHPGQTARWPRR